MRITVIGSGYVGLVTGACLAHLDHQVTCVDVDGRKIECILSGSAPFYEPGLNAVLPEVLANGSFTATTDIRQAAAEADLIFIAVGTPSKVDGSADASAVEQAAADIASALRPGATIVTKSTVPVGTARRIRAIIEQTRPGLNFSVASNPEFLREGSAVRDFLQPDRILVGSSDPRARQALRQVYAPLTTKGIPLVELGVEAAELAKYAANGLLAAKVAYINEIADLCEVVGVDIDQIAYAVGLDPRIGAHFLNAGPGFGGSCFPKDLRALAAMGLRSGARQNIIEQVWRSNEQRKSAIAQRMLKLLECPGGKTVAILGLSFKPHTSDTRESAALAAIETLRAAGVTVRTHDYAADSEIPGITKCSSPYEAAEGAHMVAIFTAWPEYRSLDWGRVANAMRGVWIFDTQRIVDGEVAGYAGLRLVSLGRGETQASFALPSSLRIVGSRQPKKLGNITQVRKTGSGQHILVAGGAGFIGQALCERLLREGQSVVVMDNLSTGTERALARLKEYGKFHFIRHDITSPVELDLPVHQIYNLACPASPPHYQADPLQTTKTSVLGAINLLELADRTGATILQASTSEIYGDPHVHPQSESYNGNVNPIGPRACYDEGKRCAETLFFDYHRQRGSRIKVCRIFNTYGPGMQPDDGRVVSNFIVQALRGEPLSLYGNGTQTRSFCFVDDLVDGLIRLMASPATVIGPINLGNPDEFTIRELVEALSRLMGRQLQTTLHPLPADDPLQRKPDIRRAAELLDWRPRVDLQEGLSKTIAYFEDVLAQEGTRLVREVA
jgi:UDP-glucuronate decarboxylase